MSGLADAHAAVRAACIAINIAFGVMAVSSGLTLIHSRVPEASNYRVLMVMGASQQSHVYFSRAWCSYEWVRAQAGKSMIFLEDLSLGLSCMPDGLKD